MNKKLHELFGLPAPVQNTELEIVASDEQNTAKLKATAEEALRHTIETGKLAAHMLMDIAAQSQHPRAFEALAKILDSTTNASDRLIELAKLDVVSNNNPSITQNNLFVGSTSDLAKLLGRTKLP